MKLTLSLSALVLFLSSVTSYSAPAPFTKKDRSPYQFPTECVMYYHGTPYRTSFHPDRTYSAEGITGGGKWKGHWAMEPSPEGYKLTVKEKLDGPPDWGWSVWSVRLDRTKRNPAEGYNYFRLE